MYLIAEIGFNHEGNVNEAGQMIKAAAEAGASAVKFQTFRAQDIALPTSPHFQAISCVEMSEKDHIFLFNTAKDCGVDFLSTPYSPWAVELLEKLGVPAFKVASMDCTNHYLLRYIAATRKPIYLSTGMATLDEIAETLHFLEIIESGPVTILHCISLYPASESDLNLAIIPLLKNLFGKPVGYSDHYPGTSACLAAAMLGAEVIETHFTLDTTKVHGDHHHSVEPESLKKLITDIRLFLTMRGKSQAICSRPDRTYAKEYRRGIYAAKPLTAGNPLLEDELLLTRPVSELTPDDLMWVAGRILSKDIEAYSALDKHCFSQTDFITLPLKES